MPNDCCLLNSFTDSTSHESFLSVALNPRRGSISTIRLLGRNFTRQVPIFRLVPLSLACGSGLLGPKHWQTDWINFELWEPIGLTTNSKTHAIDRFNFPDYRNEHLSRKIWRLTMKQTISLVTWPQSPVIVVVSGLFSHALVSYYNECKICWIAAPRHK